MFKKIVLFSSFLAIIGGKDNTFECLGTQIALQVKTKEGRTLISQVEKAFAEFCTLMIGEMTTAISH